jgi:hypothetical protein
MKRDTKLHLAHSVGKRIDMVADHLLWKLSTVLSPPTFRDPLEIYTDGNPQYETYLPVYFRKDCLIYGRVIKYKKNGRLVYRTKEKIFRNPDWEDIDTTVIENYNGVLRERISRLVRRAKTFSKKRLRYEHHLDIFQSYNNFMKQEESKTPLMREGKVKRIWQWNDFFMYR